jgi:hypothetical protein
LRKTSLILSSLSKLIPPQTASAPVTYYALDLEKRELIRTLDQLNGSNVGKMLVGKVDIKGLCATYDEGLKFVEEGGLEHRNIPDIVAPVPFEHYQLARMDREASSRSSSAKTLTNDTEITSPSTPDASPPPLHIMFLGSSLGNFSHSDSATFLRSLPLKPGSGDTLLIGLDHDNNREKIETAYNDPKGYTRKFIMNGLKVAGRTLGDENMFNEERWEYVNTYNEKQRMPSLLRSKLVSDLLAFQGRHEAYYKSLCNQTVYDPSSNTDITFLADEMIRVEVSHKVSQI